MLMNPEETLIELLSDSDEIVRMNCLNFLSESYADSDLILPSVLTNWEKHGVPQAYSEFPMLSYFPIPTDRIAEVFERAIGLADGRKLTDPHTRAAGKLVEQTVLLPADQLEQHLELLSKTVSSSKIFFRVDLNAVKERIKFTSLSADELAAELDESIASLMINNQDERAWGRGLHGLEALRAYHPNYLDLAAVLAKRPPDTGPAAFSFLLCLQSLTRVAAPNIEAKLATHLRDDRERIYSMAVDALVRARSLESANLLIEQFRAAATSDQGTTNQQWIARGLQRMMHPEMSESIAKLRTETTDPALWLMLLVAEVRQFNLTHNHRILSDLRRVNINSLALANALNVYAKLSEDRGVNVG